MIKKALFLTCAILAFQQVTAQRGRESGKIRGTDITPSSQKEKERLKDKNLNKPIKKDDEEFSFEEEPKLRFSTEFEPTRPADVPAPKVEPIKELNTAVHEDTSTIDEGQTLIVEIEETAQFAGSEDFVTIASHFSVWDTNHKDPYGIDAKDFEEVIPIKLYDISQGRYWSGAMNKGITNSKFGWRNRRWHTGIDLDLETGDPIYASFDGIVRVAGYNAGGYGRYVVLRHYNGLETLYGHLSKINFESGTMVKAGDEIGLGGSTGRSSGPHLHYETMYEGNPFDPTNIYHFAPSQINIISQEFLLTSRVYDYLRGGATKSDFEFEEDEPQNIVQKVWTIVRPGDTLAEIADKFNTTVEELCKLNRIKPYYRLKAGTRLRIK
jgi:murein DD-endopeptidase MepM/ murein hydrolase activator NlpD